MKGATYSRTSISAVCRARCTSGPMSGPMRRAAFILPLGKSQVLMSFRSTMDVKSLRG